MASRCEQIVTTIVSALRKDFGAEITRGRAVPLGPDDAENIDVLEISDDVVRVLNDKTERALTLEFRIFARAEDPRARLDMLRVLLHRRLFTDEDLVEIRQGLADFGCEWSDEINFPGAALVRPRYRFTYRCDRADLETN